MTAKEEASNLVTDFMEYSNGNDYPVKQIAAYHMDKRISLLKSVMGNCSSTSERYELTNLIKHYKEVKQEIEKL